MLNEQPDPIRFCMLVLALLCVPPSFAFGQTNRPILGVFPLANVSVESGHDRWSNWLPEILQRDLLRATPQRFEVYLNKVRTELTNSAWNSNTAVSRELADQIARQLNLSKMVLGNFKRDQNGWKLSLQLLDAGSSTPGRSFEITESTTLKLRTRMNEEVCQALGLQPDAEWLATWLKSKASNTEVDRFFALDEALESGQKPEQLVKEIREALSQTPGFLMGQEILVRALLMAEDKPAALAEAKKLIAMAPRLCAGYVSAAYSLEAEDQEAERFFLEALKVHPGCPSAARPLFLAWVNQERWVELKKAAGTAHQALPEEKFTTAILALALTRLNETDAAYELIEKLGSLEDEPDAEVHGLILSAAAGTSMRTLGREVLWLQRQCATNREARDIISGADETFYLRSATPFTNTLPRVYSAEELNARLSTLLSAEECALLENPLAVTAGTSNTAIALTTGLTNPVMKAVILFASVVEERLTAEQATNAASPAKLQVCHYYASRFATLARSVGIPAWLVHVDLAGELASGYHDRTAVKLGDEVLQFDPTAATIAGWKDKARILDDVQAVAHHLLQGNDLARIRIAQKLDNDLWARTMVVVKLASLQSLEEAEQLWSALGPEASNRWDYYFSRAAIEERRNRPIESARWLERAAQMSTNNSQIEEAMGQVYSELGRSAEAAEHLATALKLGASRSDPPRKGELETALKFSQGMKEAGHMNSEELLLQATKGQLHAQLTLAKKLFENGQNDEGLKWLLAAAKQGDPVAQSEGARNLLLLRGPSAGPQALDLLRRAAEQDFVKAFYPLSMLLYEGKVVPKDEAEATMWARLGSDAGDPSCRSLLKEIQLFADPVSFVEGGKKAQERLARKSR